MDFSGLRKDSTMTKNSGNNGNGHNRIEALLRREAALKTAIAAEKVKE
jgi:hypothetical protein